MHILANGAGRNLRSTITNHLNIRIMKQRIKKHLKEWGGLYILEGIILAFFVYCWIFNYLRVTYDLGWDFSVIKFFLDRISVA